jgi:hypothetical protein
MTREEMAEWQTQKVGDGLVEKGGREGRREENGLSTWTPD